MGSKFSKSQAYYSPPRDSYYIAFLDTGTTSLENVWGLMLHFQDLKQELNVDICPLGYLVSSIDSSVNSEESAYLWVQWNTKRASPILRFDLVFYPRQLGINGQQPTVQLLVYQMDTENGSMTRVVGEKYLHWTIQNPKYTQIYQKTCFVDKSQNAEKCEEESLNELGISKEVLVQILTSLSPRNLPGLRSEEGTFPSFDNINNMQGKVKHIYENFFESIFEIKTRTKNARN